MPTSRPLPNFLAPLAETARGVVLPILPPLQGAFERQWPNYSPRPEKRPQAQKARARCYQHRARSRPVGGSQIHMNDSPKIKESALERWVGSDLRGRRFGKLIVIEVVQLRSPRTYKVQCDCGKVKTVQGQNLTRTSNPTRSCGCKAKLRVRHGHACGENKSPTWRSWRAMKQRCLYPKAMNYPDYGGRGITVCQRWMKFDNFLSDMGERPDGTTIDRIDSNGNYEPSNCRWSTSKMQNANRKNSKLFTLNGKTQCLPDWARDAGLSEGGLRARLKKGMSLADAIDHPPRKAR